MRQYLVCIDSDGSAIDTMTIKHTQCFGPDLVKVWRLEAWSDYILNRWNRINLFSITRGINRFEGLLRMLKEINEKITKIDGIQDFQKWMEMTPAYSEMELKKEIERHPESPILSLVLKWSEMVNKNIDEIPNKEKIPFPGVEQALEKLQKISDIAIVSSANPLAVEEEWNRCGLMQYVNYTMAQDVGTKEACILSLIKKGYSLENMIMIGDAEGDFQAAQKTGILFYPILAGKEAESWKRFEKKISKEYVEGKYNLNRQREELDLFYQNLKKKKN